MICNFYPFNFVISYTNKLPILWFISWYHSNNDWKYYNTFLQSCTFNQDLKEQKWQQDYVWSLNEKTYFKKPNVNATIFPYPLYTSIVYGCSIPHRHSDATQMDKMCVQFLYARRTFQMVAVWNDRLDPWQCVGGTCVQYSMYMNEIFVHSDLCMYFSNCTKSKWRYFLYIT